MLIQVKTRVIGQNGRPQPGGAGHSRCRDTAQIRSPSNCPAYSTRKPGPAPSTATAPTFIGVGPNVHRQLHQVARVGPLHRHPGRPAYPQQGPRSGLSLKRPGSDLAPKGPPVARQSRSTPHSDPSDLQPLGAKIRPSPAPGIPRKEVIGSTLETPSDLGAPLRNRTLDLLLTMYRSAVPQLQVGQLTCQNTSGGSPHRHWTSSRERCLPLDMPLTSILTGCSGRRGRPPVDVLSRVGRGPARQEPQRPAGPPIRTDCSLALLAP